MTKEDEEAFAELRSMSRKELDLVPFDIVKWRCDCKGCTNNRKFRDYGVAPIYYRPTGNGYWINAEGQGSICGKHARFWERLDKAGFSHDHILRTLVDQTRPMEERITLIKKDDHCRLIEQTNAIKN